MFSRAVTSPAGIGRSGRDRASNSRGPNASLRNIPDVVEGRDCEAQAKVIGGNESGAGHNRAASTFVQMWGMFEKRARAAGTRAAATGPSGVELRLHP
jgi:hypothetical protein